MVVGEVNFCLFSSISDGCRSSMLQLSLHANFDFALLILVVLPWLTISRVFVRHVSALFFICVISCMLNASHSCRNVFRGVLAVKMVGLGLKRLSVFRSNGC